MKKFCYVAVSILIVTTMASCINDEEATDLEIIAPKDSTVTSAYPNVLP